MQNGPVSLNDVTIVWYKDDKIHREDGPAMIHPNGAVTWYLNDKVHREYGPAMIHPDGSKVWYFNNRCHNMFGPAIINSQADDFWYLNGIEYKKEKHPFNIFRSEYNLSDNYEEWTTDMKMLFKLIYSGY